MEKRKPWLDEVAIQRRIESGESLDKIVQELGTELDERVLAAIFEGSALQQGQRLIEIENVVRVLEEVVRIKKD